MTTPSPGPAPAVHATPAALVGTLVRQNRGPQRSGGNVSVGWGTVTAISGATCTVLMRGRTSIAGVAKLKTYTPTVGDRVVLIEWSTASGEDRLILGAV